MALLRGRSARQITVFGGSGFIGRHLVQRLAARGDVVRVAVRDPEAALFLKPMGDVGQIVIVKTDIQNRDSIDRALAGADGAVNLVGILYESGFGRNRARFEAIHHLGARNVAEAAREAGLARLVHVSAIGADKNALSLYAASKGRGEAALREAFPDAAIVRPSVVFGPEDLFFNRFAALMRFMPFLPVFGCGLPRLEFNEWGFPRLNIFGDGGTRFQPVYVGDVADAIGRILDNPKTNGSVYELGGPKIYSFKALMELLMAQTGRKRLLLPIPFWAAMADAFFLERLPRPLVTRDQIRLLRSDNVVSPKAAKLADLGLAPRAAEIMLPTYLSRFARPGRRNFSRI